MARTDIHAPTNMDPARYEYVSGFAWNAPKKMPNPDDPTKDKIVQPGYFALFSRPEGVYSSEGKAQCDHCGSHLIYVAVLRHADGGFIGVGYDCLEERFELTGKAEWDRKRLKSMNKRLEAVRYNEDVRERFKEQHPELYEFLREAHEEGGDQLPFVLDIARKFFGSWPELTERQIEALEKCRKGREKFLARKAERDAEQAKARPVETGKGVQIEAEVVKVDERDTPYGMRLVFTLKTKAGQVYWGSVPTAISDVEVGEWVALTANVEGAPDSQHFGFLSRPRKARKLDGSKAVAEARCSVCDTDLREAGVPAGHSDKCPDCEGLPF